MSAAANERTVAFCSNPTSVRYIVDLIQLSKDPGDILVYVTDASAQSFLAQLDLNVRIICDAALLPRPSIWNPVTSLRAWWVLRRRARDLYKAGVRRAIFFSNYFDWVTFGIVAWLLRRQCHAIMYDIFRIPRPHVAAKSPRQVARLAILRLLTGSEIYLSGEGKQEIATLDLARAGIDVRPYGPLNRLLPRFTYPLPYADRRCDVLLFEGCEGEAFEISGYEQRLRRVLDELAIRGFRVAVKPHPRRGASSFLRECGFPEIPASIPAEFIDFSAIKLVAGIATAALATTEVAAGTSRVSLLHLIFDEDDPRLEHYRRYLADLSEDVIFPRSIEELIAAVKV